MDEKKYIFRRIALGILSLPIIYLGYQGCQSDYIKEEKRLEEEHKQLRILSGHIINEKFIPGRYGLISDDPHQYSFLFDTNHGKKIINVFGNDRALVNLDALVENGDSVEVKDIHKNSLEDREFNIGIDKIKIVK